MNHMAVGQAKLRIDGAAKVSGKARYTDDFYMPGTRVAKYYRSAIAHGRVSRIETKAAKALPGVDAVFTFEDVPDILFATAGHPYSMDPGHRDVADRLLLTGTVRYHGDEIAVVVAKDEVTVHKALELIQVEYEEYPPLVRNSDVMGGDAREIHEGSGNKVGEHGFVTGGDAAEAKAASGHLLKGSYSTAIVHHCHLENHTTLAYMDHPGHIVIISSTQIPHIARRIVGEALGMPLSHIRVIKPYIGGGFGNKQDVVLEPMAAWLTKQLNGVPVRLSLSREECIKGTRVRHPFEMRMQLGVSDAGEVKYIGFDGVSNTGAYASHGHSIAAAGAAKIHYMYPRAVYECHAKTIYGNIPAGGAMRAYGSPQYHWATECIMEEAARKLGMDSMDFRLKNVARVGDVNSLTQKPILACGLAECLERARELIRWDEKRRDWPGDQQGPLRRGLGVASFSYASGTYPVCVEAAGARLILNQDGSVTLQVGATEIGQGADTIFAQMAAETLGIPFEKVKLISFQDTDVTPFDTGAYASRQTYVNGHAVARTSQKLKDAILAYAGEISGQDQANLDIRDGDIVFSGDGVVVMSLEDLAIDSYYHKDRGHPLTAEDAYKTRTNAPVFGCTVVDLEVDIPFCKVKIHEIYNVHDSGRIINPLNAKGQVQGGMAMGIGAALYEQLLVDPKSGRIPNNNLLDYKVPTIMDVPDLGLDFVEIHEPTNPYGAKALGEPPIITPAPAIRNAILDATGVAVNSLPMDPQNLFKHFKAAGLL
jgi:xanthine dehydrogenase molybdenum-binding subunit